MWISVYVQSKKLEIFLPIYRKDIAFTGQPEHV